jgi:hypothetical protein
MSLDWDKQVPHEMCKDALLLNAPACHDQLKQMEQAVARKRWLVYKEHCRVLGDILEELQERSMMPAAAAERVRRSLGNVRRRESRIGISESRYIIQTANSLLVSLSPAT